MSRDAFTSNCTCSALRKAARLLSRVYDGVLASQGLTVSQFSILAVLGRWSGVAPTVQALANALVLDRTTLGHNLRPLQRDGLVSLRADPSDGRVRRVQLTAEGEARLTAAVPFWRDAQERFEAAFGPGRATALRHELGAVARGFAAEAPPTEELER